MKRTLVLFAAASALAVPAAPPICIVGAGPAGLTLANRLESRGLETVIFEKNAEVGGKCQTFYEENGLFHPLGALLYSNISYNETLPMIQSSGVPSIPFSYTIKSWLYNWTSGEVHEAPATPDQLFPMFQPEIERYTTFWNTVFAPQTIPIGYKNGVPKEYRVSTSQWLSENNYQLLPILFIEGMVPYGYGDIAETPIIYMLQYFTPEFLLFFAGQHQGFATDFHQVFVQFANNSVKAPIYLGTNITNIDRSGEYPTITYSNKAVSSATQSCSKLILAFPPVLHALEAANLDISPDERTVFSSVGITKYWSGAVRLATPSGVLFVAESPAPNVPSDAAGEPVAFLGLFNTSDIATTWSWGKYRSNETLEQARALLKATLSRINKDPTNATQTPEVVTDADVKDFREWDYFPHYDQAQLADGYYDKFNDLQGQKNTFYASGFNAFETVEFAVRAGIDIADTYFSNSTAQLSMLCQH